MKLKIFKNKKAISTVLMVFVISLMFIALFFSIQKNIVFAAEYDYDTCGDNENGCLFNPYGECDYEQVGCLETNYAWSSTIGNSTSGCWSGMCCGDDSNEYVKTRVCDNSYACASSSTDKACCNLSGDCVHNACYSSGSHTHDVDANGDDEYCSSGKWYDCYDTGDCDPVEEFAYTESSNPCVSGECHEACSSNDCIYQRYEGNGDCDSSNACYNSDCIPDTLYLDLFLGAGMCDNNVGAICTGGASDDYDVCVDRSSGHCLIDHDWDDAMADCTGSNCIKAQGETFDVDNDGDSDVCSGGLGTPFWVDCTSASHCGINQYCSSGNNCVSCECTTVSSCCDGCFYKSSGTVCSTADYCSGDGWYTGKTCDADGHCDVPNGSYTACSDASCTSDGDGTYSSRVDSTCSGGSCSSNSPVSCGNFYCNGVYCYNYCDNDNFCNGTSHCFEATTCLPNLADCSVCTADNECVGYCRSAYDGGKRCTSSSTGCVSNTSSSCEYADGYNLCSENSYYRNCSSGTWSGIVSCDTTIDYQTCSSGCGWQSQAVDTCDNGSGILSGGCSSPAWGSCTDCGEFTAYSSGCNNYLAACSTTCGATCNFGQTQNTSTYYCSGGDSYRQVNGCEWVSGNCYWNDSTATDTKTECGNYICSGGYCEDLCTSNLNCITGYGCNDSNQCVACQCSPGSACCDDNCFYKSNSTTCRYSAGDCDIAETCTGSSALCPTDIKLSAGTTCRISNEYCDRQEYCDGNSADCPTDENRPDGVFCGFCKACSSGSCRNASPPTDPGSDCPAANCNKGYCNGFGSCSFYDVAEQGNCSFDYQCNADHECVPVYTHAVSRVIDKGTTRQVTYNEPVAFSESTLLIPSGNLNVFGSQNSNVVIGRGNTITVRSGAVLIWGGSLYLELGGKIILETGAALARRGVNIESFDDKRACICMPDVPLDYDSGAIGYLSQEITEGLCNATACEAGYHIIGATEDDSNYWQWTGPGTHKVDWNGDMFEWQIDTIYSDSHSVICSGECTEDCGMPEDPNYGWGIPANYWYQYKCPTYYYDGSHITYYYSWVPIAQGRYKTRNFTGWGIECTPNCVDKNCGDDTCGGVCGTCDSYYFCTAGVCEYCEECYTGGGGGGCFSGDSLVSLKNGKLKPIKDIQLGQEILGWDEKTHQKVVSKVKKVFIHDNSLKNNKWELYRIAFSSNNVMNVTTEHKIYTFNKGWIPVRDLEVGDKVMSLYNSHNKEVVIDIRKNYQKKDIVYNLYTSTHNYFISGILVHNLKAVAPPD